MHNPRDSLFRREVTEARKRRLQGEVILKQSTSAKWVVVCLVIVIIAVGLWITTGSYARTEQALGILETTKPSAKVVVTRPGIVAELNVTEGRSVEKGERIALIDVDRKNESGLAAASISLISLENRVSLAKGRTQIAQSSAFAEKTRLNMLVSSTNEQLADLNTQLDIQKDIVRSNQSLMEKIENLVEKGFITKVNYEQRRQNMLNSQQALSRLEQQIVSLKADRSGAIGQLSRVTLDAALELSNIDNSIQSLNQQRAQLQGEKSYVLNAPIAGFVTALQTSVGRTATGNYPLKSN